jgi:hypothetical protein
LHSPVLSKAQHDLQSHIGRFKNSPNGKVSERNYKIKEKKRTTSVPPKLKNEDGN